MARPISIIELTAEEDEELRRRVREHSTSKRDSLRAAIVLCRASGMKQQDVAKELGMSVVAVNKWSQRFEREGIAGLADKPGRGRKPSIPLHTVERVITEATRPPKPRARWSTRSMAHAVGISADSVRRIWRANDLKPHVVETFKLSSDPCFEEKFWDVIGLYLDPPERALILCCGDESQCQTLERSQLGLPLSPGHARTRTHDYIRHGTIALFAALSYLDGTLIGRTEETHTHVEWLRFLKQVDRETPKNLAVHLIVDNYCTHIHARVKEWLSRHPRFRVHSIPTGSSWMNLVERFFADLTADVVREGSFTHVRQLVADIELYLAQRNANPKPYRWRAQKTKILAKIRRAKQVMAAAKAQCC